MITGAIPFASRTAQVLAALAVTLSASTATAWVGNGEVRTETPVPVYMHPNITFAIQQRCPNQTGADFDNIKIANEIRWAINEFNQSAAAVRRLVYAGLSSGYPSVCDTAGDCRIPGAIHIVPQTYYPPERDGAVAYDIVNDLIIFRPQSIWDTWSPSFPACCSYGEWPTPCLGHVRILVSDLMFTFAQAYGLGVPPYECDPTSVTAPYCTMMHFGVNGSTYGTTPYADDTAGLIDIYGNYYVDTRRHHESSDAVSWSSLTPGSAMFDFMPQMAASSSGAGLNMFVVTRDSTLLITRPYMWNWSTLAWTTWTSPHFLPVFGRTGAAMNGSVGHSFFTIYEDNDNVEKRLANGRHPSAGSVTTTEYSTAILIRQGVSASYSGVDDVFVQAWANNGSELMLQLVNGQTYLSPIQVNNSDGKPVTVFGTPAVTCGPSSLNRQCLAVWADAKGSGRYNVDTGLFLHDLGPEDVKNHVLSYMHFTVTYTWIGGAKFYYITTGNVVRTGFPIFDSPQAAYHNGTSGHKFVVSVREAPTTTAANEVLVFRKSVAEGTLFDWPVGLGFAADRANLGSALGSANNTVELLRITRGQP